MGYSPRGRKESDTTEWLNFHFLSLFYLYIYLDKEIPLPDINNLRYADNTTLMAESEEELKSLSMKVKEKGEKAGLKLNTQKTKIMVTSLHGK